MHDAFPLCDNIALIGYIWPQTLSNLFDQLLRFSLIHTFLPTSLFRLEYLQNWSQLSIFKQGLVHYKMRGNPITDGLNDGMMRERCEGRITGENNDETYRHILFPPQSSMSRRQHRPSPPSNRPLIQYASTPLSPNQRLLRKDEDGIELNAAGRYRRGRQNPAVRIQKKSCQRDICECLRQYTKGG